MLASKEELWGEQLPLFRIEPEKEIDSKNFANQEDYLQSLEREARIRILSALAGKDGDRPAQAGVNEPPADESKGEATSEEIDQDLWELPLRGRSKMDLRMLAEKAAAENRRSAEKSIRQGMNLPFESLCQSFRLDPFERAVVLLLFAKSNNARMQELIEKHGPPHWKAPNGGMKIGTLLEIITEDPDDQMGYRKYFDVGAPLIREGIVIPPKEYAKTANVLEAEVCLDGRIFRHILGDKNGYDPIFQYISRDRRPIEIDRVILPEKIKEEVLRLAENYIRHKSEMKQLGIHEFYGYGRGLTFLFYGPSGTGKTMLAHALAHRLKMDLLSLNVEDAHFHESSVHDAIGHIFKEARLSDGIVFFDECNDLFEAGTCRSRSLLLEIEKADCITLLATNKPEELDPSLDRRINLQVPFHLPDESQREKIWRALIPPKVVLGETVDLQRLAQKFILTGGLIKNAIFMAIQNSIGKNGSSRIILDQKEMERAAAYQMAGMLKQKEIETVYQPQIRLEDLGLRGRDKAMLQRMAMVYEEGQGRGFGLNVVVGSSDIQTGIDCAEGVAKELNLVVRRFPFSRLFGEYISIQKRRHYTIEREIHILDRAFKRCPGLKEILLFVDPDSFFEKLLWQEKPRVKEYEDFLAKLRSFQGMFFLVTRPVRKQELPIEIHHYLEIQYPLEEVQVQRWETHLTDHRPCGEDLVDLVERYPLHLHEIDYVAKQARVAGILEGEERHLTIARIKETVARFKRKGEPPILFGAAGN